MWLISVTASFAQVSLPENVTLTPPAADVPSGAARFAGAWDGGAWEGILPIVAVVEQVGADGTAAVLHARGDAPSWHVKRGCYRLSAKIANGRLTVTLPDGQIAEFDVTRNGRLFGGFNLPDQPSSEGWCYYGRLTRTAAHDPAGVTAAAALPRQQTLTASR